jgi:hypothetical protein
MRTPIVGRNALIAGAAAALLAGCGGPQTTIGVPEPMLQTSAIAGQAAPQTFTPGHLYVAQGDDIQSIVYRFLLNADGLPATKPDGKLMLHFTYPDAIGSIAIGPNGDLYVSSAGTSPGCNNESKCFVEVFAPGASRNAKPIRKLYVPQQPLYIAVDERGYLDVSVLQGGGNVTNVYKPNARGNEAPVNVIKAGVVNALAATRGVVYIQTENQGIAGVDEHSHKQPVYFTYKRQGNSANGVATDATQLYAQYYWYRRNGGAFLATAVYRLDQPGAPIRSIVGTGCKESFSGGGVLGYGLAVYKNYLYEGCIGLGGAAGGVLVYDATKKGMQQPIEQLSGGNGGVAIGP